jgi:hypothetical protein
MTSRSGSRPSGSSSSTGVSGPGTESGPSPPSPLGTASVVFFASARLSAICSRTLSFAGLRGGSTGSAAGDLSGDLAGERPPDFAGDTVPGRRGTLALVASRGGAGARVDVVAGRVPVPVPAARVGVAGVDVARAIAGTRVDAVVVPGRARDELGAGMRDMVRWPGTGGGARRAETRVRHATCAWGDRVFLTAARSMTDMPLDLYIWVHHMIRAWHFHT